MNKDDYIYLVWQDPKSREKMVVGELLRNDGYTFFYTKDYQKARGKGWEMLKPFPEEKRYHSDVLFPVFSCRLPDPKRRDIGAILSEYGLNEYDEYNLLKKTGAKLPIDSYEFIDPIFPDDESVERSFYISGVRHKAACIGEHCQNLNGISVGDALELEMEPENLFDKNAVLILHDGIEIGYVPSYYCEAVSIRLRRGMTYGCTVQEVNNDGNCRECIKVLLKMPL